MMDDLNVGALPVCDGDRLVGMITDRDITVRATSVGVAPEAARVEEVMSEDVRWCFEDQSLDEVMQQMADTQIRRVPVVSHADAHILIGIVALGDLATKTADDAKKQDVEQVVEKVSSPAEPDRSQQPGAASGASSDMNAGAGAAGASTAGSTDNTGSTGAPGGTGAAGASGGTAGTAGPLVQVSAPDPKGRYQSSPSSKSTGSHAPPLRHREKRMQIGSRRPSPLRNPCRECLYGRQKHCFNEEQIASLRMA